jgi:xylose isomerase
VSGKYFLKEHEMAKLKYAVGLQVFGPVADRYLFTGYHPTLSIEERLEKVSKVKSIEGIEFPYGSFANRETIGGYKKFMQQLGIRVISLSASVTANMRFAKGSLTNPDPLIRQEAVTLVQEVMNTAADMNVPIVNLWMGQEGFDYIMETDYTETWKIFVDALRQCAQVQPKVKLCVEYKSKEPRSRSLPNSSSQALLLVKETGCDNLAVTLDIGHAIMAAENPSQAMLLLHQYKKLGYIHLNDNYGDWDWDMAAGMNNWWQLIEFCYWLQEIKFNDYLTLDVAPFRQEPEEICNTCTEAIDRAWDLAEKIDRSRAKEIFATRDGLAALRMLMSLK